MRPLDERHNYAGGRLKALQLPESPDHDHGVLLLERGTLVHTVVTGGAVELPVRSGRKVQHLHRFAIEFRKDRIILSDCPISILILVLRQLLSLVLYRERRVHCRARTQG